MSTRQEVYAEADRTAERRRRIRSKAMTFGGQKVDWKNVCPECGSPHPVPCRRGCTAQ